MAITADDFVQRLTEKDTGYLMNRTAYTNTIEDVKRASSTATGKTRRDYYLLKKYEIMQCGDVEKLIRKQDQDKHPLYFIPVEDMFHVIKQAHQATGHGGRDRMQKELSKKYAGIPKEAVELYKAHCEECQKKTKRPRVKGVVVNPILTSDVLSRCHVDLIDMQWLPCGHYRWILVYQDHFTRFVLLRPLMSKRAAEVASHLVDIFSTIGAPAILQSDNGSKFTAKLITDVTKIWPTLKLVHGKPRQPQSQGSVERANGDIKDMLVAWMNDNKTTEWSWGLKFVQFMKNSSDHAGIGHSLFKGMFGVDAKIGLQSGPLPDDILHLIQTEGDLFHVAKRQAETVGEDNGVHNESDVTEASVSQLLDDNIVHSFLIPVDHSAITVHTLDLPVTHYVSTASGTEANVPDTVVSDPDAEATVSDAEGSDTTVTISPGVSTLDAIDIAPDVTAPDAVATVPDVDAPEVAGIQFEKFHVTRKRTQQTQLKQAERMLKRSRTNLMAANNGDSVKIPILMVDRGRGDPRNLIGIILDRNEHDMYKLGVTQGVLKGRFSRNKFDVCQETFLSRESVDQTKCISLREAVVSDSLGGGQGFVKCNCVGERGNKCATNRCKCFKQKLKCNS